MARKKKIVPITSVSAFIEYWISGKPTQKRAARNFPPVEIYRLFKSEGVNMVKNRLSGVDDFVRKLIRNIYYEGKSDWYLTSGQSAGLTRRTNRFMTFLYSRINEAQMHGDKKIGALMLWEAKFDSYYDYCGKFRGHLGPVLASNQAAAEQIANLMYKGYSRNENSGTRKLVVCELLDIDYEITNFFKSQKRALDSINEEIANIKERQEELEKQLDRMNVLKSVVTQVSNGFVENLTKTDADNNS